MEKNFTEVFKMRNIHEAFRPYKSKLKRLNLKKSINNKS